MKRLRIALWRAFPSLALTLWIGAGVARAQEDEPAEVTRYREDYERYKKIEAIADPAKRGDQIIQFIKDRPNSKMTSTAQGNLFSILDSFIKSDNNGPLLSLSERYIKVRPKQGETYYCYGFALRNLKRYDEAMNALAKCYLLKNPVSAKAKDFLDLIYKGQHRGSLAGQQQIIAKAKQELAAKP